MTPTLEPPIQPIIGVQTSIMDKTVAISITFGLLGNSRKVSTSQIQVNADKALINVSKKLLDSKELKEISKHDSETRSWLMEICLPSLFRSGIYLVPIAAIQMVEEYLEKRKEERKGLIDAFLATYETSRNEAEIRLQAVFNAMDYPPLSEVRASFTLGWQWINFSTPTTLKTISAEFFEKEKQKAEQHWAEAGDEIQLLLRTQMKGLVDHMLDRIKPGDDGKPRRFKASTVTNITQFLDTFSIRNITDDAELACLVETSKKLLSGTDAEDLRKNDVTRDNLALGFGKVKEFLDQMVETAGSRKIVLEEEEADAVVW